MIPFFIIWAPLDSFRGVPSVRGPCLFLIRNETWLSGELALLVLVLWIYEGLCGGFLDVLEEGLCCGFLGVGLG